MTEICPQKNCTGCGACGNVCPKDCISMKKNVEGFLYPAIDENICINCGRCAKVCPVNSDVAKNDIAEFYMAWHKDTSVLKRSSSGGVFTALADYVLSRGGVVVGAEMNGAREIIHGIVDNKADLDRFRLSKYYQSDVGSVYREIKTILENGRYVLFSGTACQVAGLYNTLGGIGKSERLITVDVLCHGVASKTVVDAYIKSKERKYKNKAKSYAFRVKDEPIGWKSGGGTRMKLEFEDGKVHIENMYTDTFFMGFNNNLFLRESCYLCKYCGTERIADFTLADFWGISEKRISEEQLNLGVSLMLINSDKARDMLPDLKEDIGVEPVSPDEAIPFNLALKRPNGRPKKRDVFFEDLGKNDYDRLVKRYYLKNYVRYYLGKCAKKVIGKDNYVRLKKLIKGS